VPRGRQFDQFPHGRTGFVIYYQIPMLVAAIDPAEESKLVGLDGAVVRGRYLEESDRTQVVRPDGRHGPALRQVPVLMAKRPLTDDRLEVRLDKLALGPAARVPGHLASAHAEDWLASRRRTSLDTVELDDRRVYRLLLRLYRREIPNSKVDYWSPGPARVHSGGQASTIDVKARPPLPAETFRSFYFGGYLAPQVSADRSFRGLLPHESSTLLDGSVPVFPVLHQVGVFDAKLLEGFSALSEVPLTNYYPPDAAPGDDRSSELLRGRALLPNANLAGYLQQPPTVLTTLRSLPTFLDPRAFPDVDPDIAAAPVSVVRVRVAGVSGADELSRERVRVVAERIARETGLQVDITIGSSPTPLRVSLPEGSYGRPRLTLEEGWVQKGVGVRLLAAVDGKSLILFGLVLAVCVLFLANATGAAVRSRRSELGVLSCLGWAPVSIFTLIEVELVVTGAVAGAAGAITATGLVPLAGLHTAWWQVLVITPTATLIAALAGVWPAWRASKSSPISATAPPVTKPRRARRVHTIIGLATAGVIRMPGRTVMGASGLMIGVAAMSALLSVQLAFRGSVVDTALGDAVAVQVRGVDYLAAVLVVGLGAFAVADIAYLNIAERTSEIGTLRALGWSDRHVRTLFAAEALLTAGLGAVVGALLAVAATTLFLGVPVTQSLSLAALVAGAGVLAALFAVAIPVLRLDRIEPASAVVTGE
jgi:putative ABC transport system permease protein